MKFKKLRIVWSVGWGILCLLLIGLWVRSYGHRRQFNVPGGISGVSDGGVVSLAKFDDFDPKIFVTDSGIPATWNVHVHYWLLTIISGLLAIASWFTWPQRFSLRTLLITTTILALALGTIVWLAHR